VALANSETGAGEPVFDPELLTEDYDYFIHPFRTVAFLDALEAYQQAGWDERNEFSHRRRGRLPGEHHHRRRCPQ